MEVFLRIDLNIVAIIMVSIILLNANIRLEKSDRMNRIFFITSTIIVLQLLFETATCILNQRPEPWAVPVSVLLHICLFSTAPGLTYFWFFFVSNWIVSDDKLLRKKQGVLFLPVILNFVLTVLSPFFSFIFYIDSTNTYHRGSLFFIAALINYFYLLLAVLLIVKYKNKIVQSEFVPLLLFGVLPLVGGTLQAFFYGLLLMWSSAGFSVVIMYLFLEQRMVQIDHLTGAWTRGSFNNCMLQRAKKRNGNDFGLLFVDVDDLKKINDEFGHAEGDFILKTTVRLMKNILKKTDVIARVGGDEFVILLDCSTKDMLNRTIKRLHDAFKQYNQGSGKDYLLECSIGAELFCSDFSDVDQLMHHVDALMYAEKRQKKEQED